MKPILFKKSRGGKKSKNWYIRFKCDGMPRAKEVNLKVSDKQVAQSKASKLILETEKELLGLIPSAEKRKAANIEILLHLQDFLNNQKALGRAPSYIVHLNNYVRKVCEDCEWVYLQDIKADKFEKWRSCQTFKSKTLNDYLAGFNTFLLWLVARQRLDHNPLAMVKKIDRRRDDKVYRRALTVEEISRLLSVCSDLHKAIYLLPLYTGMRRNEIKSLEWQDLNLKGENPSVIMRARATKDAKLKTAPLSYDIVQALLVIKTEKAQGKVFPVFPRFEKMKKDWNKANIPVVNKKGLRADFHSLRKTFCTLLFKAGVSQRVAQEAMRHSEARLTNQVYTDASQLKNT